MDIVARWFLENRRSFPWREEKSPYGVLISEVMLQQTRAVVVVSYFQRWMKKFPTIHALANASEEEVIKLWEGLGYYSRARNLLKLALEVVEKFEGVIPSSYEELLKLKGIGHYTAGAILAFGFEKKAVALDGNVIRVISRYVGFAKDAKKYQNELRQITLDLLPNEDAHVVMEGLIELGATVCTKKPICQECPLKRECKAYQNNQIESFPILPQKPKSIELFRFVGCIYHDNEILLKLNPPKGIMAGLYEFPYIQCDEDFNISEAQEILEKQVGLNLTFIAPLKREKHHFTKFKANLFPSLFQAPQKSVVSGYVWVDISELETLPFSSGHKKILTQLCSIPSLL